MDVTEHPVAPSGGYRRGTGKQGREKLFELKSSKIQFSRYLMKGSFLVGRNL